MVQEYVRIPPTHPPTHVHTRSLSLMVPPSLPRPPPGRPLPPRCLLLPQRCIPCLLPGRYLPLTGADSLVRGECAGGQAGWGWQQGGRRVGGGSWEAGGWGWHQGGRRVGVAPGRQADGGGQQGGRRVGVAPLGHAGGGGTKWAGAWGVAAGGQAGGGGHQGGNRVGGGSRGAGERVAAPGDGIRESEGSHVFLCCCSRRSHPISHFLVLLFQEATPDLTLFGAAVPGGRTRPTVWRLQCHIRAPSVSSWAAEGQGGGGGPCSHGSSAGDEVIV